MEIYNVMLLVPMIMIAPLSTVFNTHTHTHTHMRACARVYMFCTYIYIQLSFYGVGS